MSFRYALVFDPQIEFNKSNETITDSPNQSAFPSAVLKAGQTYDHTAKFSFSAK